MRELEAERVNLESRIRRLKTEQRRFDVAVLVGIGGIIALVAEKLLQALLGST